MKRRHLLFALMAVMAPAATVAQVPVRGVADPESLFTDPDPQLHENKQVVLHIMRELLQCSFWDQADRWLTERYIQHNPNVASGRAGVVEYFTSRREPAPSCEALETPIVAVLADDDLVTVVWPLQCEHPETGARYTSTWFDMWRIMDGRADEHWDPAVRVPTGCSPGAPPE
jgi:predicted SnoaL-like aldol condensation-catalyzing enzyme